MNKTSSRSHAVVTLYYQEKSIKNNKKQVINAKINIVDLAGSERQASTGATGDRLKEGSNINKSLTYLRVVIQKLGERSKGGSVSDDFVPYRNSQLTHLLSESLGGNKINYYDCCIISCCNKLWRDIINFKICSKCKHDFYKNKCWWWSLLDYLSLK